LDKKCINKGINSTYVSTTSKFVNLFEKICNLTKAKFTVTTFNGTVALEFAIKSLELDNESEILIPNLNYVGSSNAILYYELTLNYINADINNLRIDYQKLDGYLGKNFIKKNFLINKKTKREVTAIIAIHIFRNPSKIEKLMK